MGWFCEGDMQLDVGCIGTRQPTAIYTQQSGTMSPQWRRIRTVPPSKDDVAARAGRNHRRRRAPRAPNRQSSHPDYSSSRRLQ